jgi:hypothetical protein
MPESATKSIVPAERDRAKLIIVSPDDVFQGARQPFQSVSLERIIFYYTVVSAAIIGVMTLLGVLWAVFAR